jgi:diguanylate cyclase (GGDEF)-like protein
VTKVRVRVDRSLETGALVAMLGVGALLCAIGAAFPPHPETPVLLDAVAAVVGSVLALTVLIVPVRARRAVSDLCLVVYVAMATALVAAAGTDVGAVTAAHGLLWFCLYVASFRRPRTARRWCALATTAITVTVGVRLGGQAGASAALVLGASAVVGTELLSRIHDRLQQLSTRDPLTGALNRAGLAAAVAPERRPRGARRSHDRHVVAVIDLDGFKAVNDEHGHGEGDRVLADLVDAWRRELRAQDVIARIGGDEFVLVLRDTDLRTADQVLARLRATSRIGWSAGLAAFGGDVSFLDALDEADARMYGAKLRREVAARPTVAS